MCATSNNNFDLTFDIQLQNVYSEETKFVFEVEAELQNYPAPLQIFEVQILMKPAPQQTTVVT